MFQVKISLGFDVGLCININRSACIVQSILHHYDGKHYVFLIMSSTLNATETYLQLFRRQAAHSAPTLGASSSK